VRISSGSGSEAILDSVITGFSWADVTGGQRTKTQATASKGRLKRFMAYVLTGD
jgi:hypothetical protein